MPARPAAPDLTPLARALRTLDLLWERPGAGAGELAGRLGVTERAVRRYVGMLREAGVPVESVPGPGGGYRLGRGARLAPVRFTQEEALGLVMAVLGGRPELVATALGKVVRALPPEVGRQAALLGAHAAAAPDPYVTRPDPVLTAELAAAVAARHRVRLGYREDEESEIDPWALVVRHGRWYLLAHSHRAAAVRTYRVDRVRTVRGTGRRFTPPSGLDPVTALEEHLGHGWEFATRVVFDAPLGEVAPWLRPHMGALEALGESSCVLVGSTRNPGAYAREWLARVPFGFRVEGGAELRAEIAALAARFAHAAEATPGTGEVTA
ncbi:helix-turn-helix transcriptional regulator [Streptomyces sp. SPB074]|uniref:helix-turn-helix transcriptional regulator n=1 Tax=Streptomyces sp. (strain SPB074) TaxID=465543 RepID=UPI00017F1EAD|nr:WYL domain-containing protein [Streptomyces sp. SPB074]EDY44153.1 transcriptional regulator [Streptomyces sp. SPB074]